ncbi:FAD-dependent oxidoreductase [Companilactobacillus hulinensis]|uniref:FAD-dependent oxidoreductase n=1 Tax=Companilactobacillus hulinensis TaxID=2486007 RepID=UPI000F77167A|nr:FAD-dependent oxidoreductase [Companilactobacillus hulinensis]
MIKNKYGYIVIGSGPAAFGLTNKLKEDNSKQTALIVDNDLFGGTCPNYGCEPKIFLEGAVRDVLIGQKLENRGIVAAPTINWKTLMETKKKVFKPYPENSKSGFENEFVDTKTGIAKIIDRHTVQIDGANYKTDKIIIATGMKPNKLNIPGNEYSHSSTDVLDMEELPKKMVFIGSGYVSMELATVVSAAGAEVEMIEFSDKALGPFYQDHVKAVVDQMKQRGIKFHFNQAANKITKTDDSKYVVHTAQGNSYEADYVVDATGRIPNVSSLNLDELGIEHDRQGIVVDEHFSLESDFAYAGTNDEHAELVGVFDKSSKLVGVSEVSQTATDDVNLFVNVIGLGLDSKVWKGKIIYIFPTLASKIKGFL